MLNYKAPVQDIKFLFEDVLDYYGHYQRFPDYAETTPDLVDSILSECARFSEKELLPLNQSGDVEGCRWDDGTVVTPEGFKKAYQQYVTAGWPSMAHSASYGGQGLPPSIGMAVSEIIGGANWSWSMYPGLTNGSIRTISAHGTEDQKQLFLPRLIEGSWSGTMCLTEPQCGTDLSQIKTVAVPNGDGSYEIRGSKIFISAGDHDLTENIVHIVLARLPDAPKGTRGISLFIVPKRNIDRCGNIDGHNNVACTSIEDKMGIKASATAALNFDGAKGVLLGPENRGLECMFTFMNTARIGSGMQGVCFAELSHQNALSYAHERLSMRSLSGAKYPSLAADPIIVHPDIRRMLLTQKAIAEGGRAMIFYTQKLVDQVVAGESKQECDNAENRLGLITPILKAFLTETGVDCARLGMQISGGHGYIRESGMEQIVRDASISTLYEGTTGIQALDLLGRKILLDRRVALRSLTREITDFCKNLRLLSRHPLKRSMHRFVWPLRKAVRNWQCLSARIAFNARRDRDFVGSASVDFLMYSGYVVMAYMWARIAQASYQKLSSGTADEGFYRAKIMTAEFYFARLLPKTKSLAKTMMADSRSVMQIDEELWRPG